MDPVVEDASACLLQLAHAKRWAVYVEGELKKHPSDTTVLQFFSQLVLLTPLELDHFRAAAPHFEIHSPSLPASGPGLSRTLVPSVKGVVQNPEAVQEMIRQFHLSETHPKWVQHVLQHGSQIHGKKEEPVKRERFRTHDSTCRQSKRSKGHETPSILASALLSSS